MAIKNFYELVDSTDRRIIMTGSAKQLAKFLGSTPRVVRYKVKKGKRLKGYWINKFYEVRV